MKGLFTGRNAIPYAYGRYGYTRGGGKVWHGGQDVVGEDNDVIHFPYYTFEDGSQKAISGIVRRARIVTDKRNKTWEWGYYVSVQLDASQTPDAVNWLYFCHCSKLLVKVGQKVKSGDALAIMGNTGNAALNNPPYKHCHIEVRATATSRGLDPTAYTGLPNSVCSVNMLGAKEEEKPVSGKLQKPVISGASVEDVEAFRELADKLSVSFETTSTVSFQAVSQGDADKILALSKKLGLKYTSSWV